LNRTASILIGLLLFVAFVAVLTWQMLGNRKVKVEVCMAYQGAKNCAVATAPTREEAIRTASSTACTLISGGVTDTMACERAQPLSVRDLE
jgi:energy-converting hydrogenase Eha subunit H